MSKEFACTICSYVEGPNHHQGHTRLYKDRVFSKSQSEVQITLCFLHSLELFKHGQKAFFVKYYEYAKNYVEHIEEEAFQVMKFVATKRPA